MTLLKLFQRVVFLDVGRRRASFRVGDIEGRVVALSRQWEEQVTVDEYAGVFDFDRADPDLLSEIEALIVQRAAMLRKYPDAQLPGEIRDFERYLRHRRQIIEAVRAYEPEPMIV